MGIGSSAAGIPSAGGSSLLGSAGKYLTSAGGAQTLGNIAGTLYGANAAGNAAKAQADAARYATDIGNQQFAQTRADMEPWRQSGIGALAQINKGTAAGGDFNRNFTAADFQADPGYQFRMDQGRQGLERSAAARGGLLNGGMVVGLGVHPFIITLGTMAMFRGVAFVVTKGQSIGGFPGPFRDLVKWETAGGLMDQAGKKIEDMRREEPKKQ